MSQRIIIAGGGTGGHIFPALAIAGALRAADPAIEILFVGAKGKMEMEKVPQAGYAIEGLDIAGFNRSSLLKNIGLPWKLVKSFWQVRSIFARFKPTGVIGVGGYSSFPVLRFAQVKGIPTFLHEANSFAGKSNILLSQKAVCVFAGVEGLERFFPAHKVIFTGNPVRRSILEAPTNKAQGCAHFSLQPNQSVLLVVGGSLGARSLNESVDEGLEKISEAGIQLIWQTGTPYANKASLRAKDKEGVWTGPFIQQMELAYAAADVVVARAGAMTVAELAIVGKPVIFVPFPLAAEDHQTQNAQQMVNKGAALLIADHEAKEKLVSAAISLCHDDQRREQMKMQLRSLAVNDADQRVAQEVLKRLSSNE
jgi:UDP-N-acetylglucosamine--N-acetylmuramyl-(pentapeptide) pyrophosphoryl-undecaprenol N-acetylglucosamine transferase